jgi:hypothetical protein
MVTAMNQREVNELRRRLEAEMAHRGRLAARRQAHAAASAASMVAIVNGEIRQVDLGIEMLGPYSGLFRMRDDVFEVITGAVGNRWQRTAA